MSLRLDRSKAERLEERNRGFCSQFILYRGTSWGKNKKWNEVAPSPATKLPHGFGCSGCYSRVGEVHWDER